MKYFDTHAHLIEEYFNEKELKHHIQNAQKKGVEKILIPGTNKKDSLKNFELIKYKQISIAVGVHPIDATNVSSADFLEKIDISQVKAIGEIGLDLFRKTNPSLEIQKIVFEKQLRFALKHNLPVLIHMRNCEEQMYEILQNEQFKNLRFVLHSFGSNWEWASKFLDLGAYISLSGIVTFKNAIPIQEVAKKVPLNRLLVETDSPFLTPTPHRGKWPNLPEYVVYVAEFIANIRKEPREQVLNYLFNNAIKLFKL